MSKIAHLLEMLITLQYKKLTTASELADVLEVDKKTIYRYINNLNKANIPVHTKKGRYGGFYIDKDFYMKPPKLTLEEFESILAMEDILNKNHFPYQRHLENAIFKIKSISVNDDKYLKDTENGTGFTIKALGNDLSLDEKMIHINYSMERGRSLNINYFSLNKNFIEKITIDPYSLIFKNGEWYIVSYCHNNDNVQLYKLSRIKKIERTNSIYIKPKTFCLNDFLTNKWQVFQDGKIVTKIKFTKNVAATICDVKWTVNQKIENMENGEVILTLYLDRLDEIKTWILGFGRDAEVLEPIALKNDVLGEIKKIFEIYK